MDEIIQDNGEKFPIQENTVTHRTDGSQYPETPERMREAFALLFADWGMYSTSYVDTTLHGRVTFATYIFEITPDEPKWMAIRRAWELAKREFAEGKRHIYWRILPSISDVESEKGVKRLRFRCAFV